MPATFHHGVEIQEVKSRTRTISLVQSAIIGVIGTAPIHHLPAAQRTLNRNVLIASDADKAYYCGADADSAGYTLNRDIEIIFKQANTAVIAINVFDPSRHRTLGANIATSGNASRTANVATVTTAAPHGLVTGDFVNLTSFAADFAPFNQDYVKITAPTATTITFPSVGADIPAAAQSAGIVKKITFTPEAVTASDIIGSVESDGSVTGMKVWATARGQFGFSPRILIAPSYSTQQSVAAEMRIIADQIRAKAVIDVPAGLTYQQVLEGRGVSGTINLNTSSPRVDICYPHVYGTSVVDGAEELHPFSPYYAGVMAATDLEEGYWTPPSNREIKGITGVERNISFDVMNSNTEANKLNAAGVVTIVRDYGTGFLVWGVRSAAFPSSSDPDSFTSVRRTKDILHDSLGYGLRPYLGKPMTLANVDSALMTINGFLRDRIAAGALMPGSEAKFLPSDNSTTQMAQGKICFYLNQMSPIPMEHIILKSQENIDLLEALYELS